MLGAPGAVHLELPPATAAPRVSDLRAGEEPRRPVLTGGELSLRRRRCQHAHHAEPHRLGGWRWPGGVTDHMAMVAQSPERKEAAKLGPYLDDDCRERAQARQGPKAELLAVGIEGRRRGRWGTLPAGQRRHSVARAPAEL